MTDRQIVSTEDYTRLKQENDKLKSLTRELHDRLPEFELMVNNLNRSLYISIAHRALYVVSFVYMAIDLYKTYF